MRHDPLVKAVARALRRRCGYRHADHPEVLVACSGGGDSQALLHALDALSGCRGWHERVVVGHVNHHLSDQADEAEVFLREQAERMGVGWVCRSVHPDRHGGNLEATARRQRHAALRSMAREAGLGVIALAHHGDDQLETMLMRLMRGSSPSGLAGMAWSRASRRGDLRLIRPLLGVTHAEVVGFLERWGIVWFEDPLNSKPDLRRNRLRREVLPALRASWPRGHERALEAADQLRAWSGWMRERTRAHADLFVASEGGAVLTAERGALAGVQGVELEMVLRERLLEAGVPADRLASRTTRQVVACVGTGVASPREWVLACGVRVALDHRSLVIRRCS
ncbi:tRNA(Ile)-lysidine synthase [Mucisphaera calidilacus]|uniref:tRNA(Ile)-lysidine synthase n=2 Tax=Mucisphaera calidilacus TaxID=2527982 RepID=A0A518BTJ7_9BACT|nr:tRNA(Ile)-lysidine synthase [Mucisphaera calidilacus]